MRQYRGQWFMRRVQWHCGDFIEVDFYPVFQKPGVRRAKSKPTSAIQERLNRRNSERKLIRTVHANFRDGDYALSLTFREKTELEEAKKKFRAFMRQARKAYRAAGMEPKYLYIIERGKNGRIDIHVIISGGIGRDALEALWKNGFANARRLQFTEKGVEALTQYMTKQGRKKDRERVTYRRWSGSKNLIHPQPEITDAGTAVREAEELAELIDRRDAEEKAQEMYPGFALTEAEAMWNRANRGLYISLHLCRRERWKCRPYALYSVVNWEEDAM